MKKRAVKVMKTASVAKGPKPPAMHKPPTMTQVQMGPHGKAAPKYSKKGG